jgi:hypothetical protein
VSELFSIVRFNRSTGDFEHLRAQLTLSIAMISMNVEQFEEQFISRFVILLLVYIDNLVFLVLEFDFKAIETTDSVLLFDQVGQIYRAEAHIL